MSNTILVFDKVFKWNFIKHQFSVWTKLIKKNGNEAKKERKERECDNYSFMKGLEAEKQKYLKDRATRMTSRENIT